MQLEERTTKPLLVKLMCLIMKIDPEKIDHENPRFGDKRLIMKILVLEKMK